jgi:hypothetical protein
MHIVCFVTEYSAALQNVEVAHSRKWNITMTIKVAIAYPLQSHAENFMCNRIPKAQIATCLIVHTSLYQDV